MKPDVDGAFDDAHDAQVDHVVVLEYLRDVRSNWSSSEDTSTRSALLIATLAAVFVLLAGKDVEEVSIAGIKVTSLALVQASLPVGVAYLWFVLTQSAAIAWRLRETHDAVCAAYLPALHARDLELTLHPGSGLTSSALLSNTSEGTGLSRALSLVGLTRFAVYLIGPLCFLAYSAQHIWRVEVGSPLTRVVVTSVAMLLILSAVPQLIYLARRVAEAQRDGD